MAATIVSIYPEKISEFKPRLIPGYFDIPGVKKGSLEVLVIHRVSFPIEIADGERTFMVPELPEDVANSIVNDWMSAKIAVDEQGKPGLFWVDGAHTREAIPKHFKEKLDEADRLQINWFRRLVDLANNEFARTKQSRAIADIQRTAARYLGFMELPWMQLEDIVIPTNCKFCTFLIPPEAVVCPNCRNVLNPEAYKSLGGAVATRV